MNTSSLPPFIEVEEAAVFQEAADNAVNFDVVTDTWKARTKDADTANDEANLDAGCRSFIEFGNDFFIEKRVHLSDDEAFFPALAQAISLSIS